MIEMKKQILLLGGFGFLGTNILKYIDAHLINVYDCIVFDKFDAHPHKVQFKSVKKVYAGDFSDAKLISQIFEENTIDMVLHVLSTTVPVDSINAQYDVQSNLLPTLGVLECMVKHHVSTIVYLSSGGAVYGSLSNKRHKESDDVFPVSSYGVIKLAIEKYIMQYAQLYDIKPVILRLSNPYGPYHYSMKQGVVNVAIHKALHNEILNVWGDGCGKKDYIYVEDFCEILFLLLQKYQFMGVLNIGSGCCLSVNEIIDEIKLILPSLSVEYTNAQKFDVSHFELDIAKLKETLGDYVFTTLKDGLCRTIEWSKEVCD